MESPDEAKRVFDISVRKLEGIKCLRVSKSLHKNLLVHTIFNRVLPLVADAEEFGDFPVSSALGGEIELTVEESSNGDDKQYTTLENVSISSSGLSTLFEKTDRVSADLHVGAEQKNEIVLPLVVPYQINSVSDEDPRNEFRGLKRCADFDEQELCSKRHRFVRGSETGDTHWRSTVDTFDLEEERDLDIECDSGIDCDNGVDCDVIPPATVRYVYHDENALIKNTMDGQQISCLITFFSSSFSGLGELAVEGKMSVKSCDNSESRPLRRANSMPNLTIKSPERKQKKNSPVLIRI